MELTVCHELAVDGRLGTGEGEITTTGMSTHVLLNRLFIVRVIVRWPSTALRTREITSENVQNADNVPAHYIGWCHLSCSRRLASHFAAPAAAGRGKQPEGV